MDIILTC